LGICASKLRVESPGMAAYKKYGYEDVEIHHCGGSVTGHIFASREIAYIMVIRSDDVTHGARLASQKCPRKNKKE